MKKTLITGVIALLVIFAAGCSKGDPDKVAERDRQKLLDYIAEHELDATEHESGLFYVVEREGTGAHPTLTSTLRIRYEGYFLDGKVFDVNPNALIQLRNTIRGWQIGMPLFRSGGKGMLLVPSNLGYGEYPPWGSSIPRNACLIFEFELIDVQVQ